MSIEELQSRSSGSQTSLSLRTGRISAVVKKNDAQPTRFQVRSPIATAAVRGTEFTFNGFQLSVQSGLVAFGSDGSRSVTVPSGMLSVMLEGGVPMDVAEAVLEGYINNPMATAEDILEFLEIFDFFDISIDDLFVTVQ